MAKVGDWYKAPSGLSYKYTKDNLPTSATPAKVVQNVDITKKQINNNIDFSKNYQGGNYLDTSQMTDKTGITIIEGRSPINSWDVSKIEKLPLLTNENAIDSKIGNNPSIREQLNTNNNFIKERYDNYSINNVERTSILETIFGESKDNGGFLGGLQKDTMFLALGAAAILFLIVVIKK